MELRRRPEMSGLCGEEEPGKSTVFAAGVFGSLTVKGAGPGPDVRLAIRTSSAKGGGSYAGPTAAL